MEQFVPLLIVVTFVVAWAWFLRQRSGGRAWSPLWLAFSATALAALFLGAGTIGYILPKRNRFIAGTSWSETVLWWEVGVGVALIPLAVYLWRRGLRSISVTLLLALNLHVFVQGQEPPGLFVIVSDGSEVRGGFQPQSQPIPDVTAVIARMSVTLSRKDVTLADGRIITGFAFDGWVEGDAVRVVVSALLPADGTNRFVEVQRGTRPVFRKEEFARMTVAQGVTRKVEEMKALGIEPMAVRVDTKSPFSERFPD